MRARHEAAGEGKHRAASRKQAPRVEAFFATVGHPAHGRDEPVSEPALEGTGVEAVRGSEACERETRSSSGQANGLRGDHVMVWLDASC